jgi:phospholipase/carboxylesterase
VRRSADEVRALIAREVERGVPEERIVLAGFSQGGAVALYAAVRHPRPLAGLVVLSSYLVLEDRLEAEATDAGKRLTALFCHGTRDDVVPLAGGRQAYERTQALGCSAEWHEFPMGHALDGDEVRVIRRFLHQRLG